MIAGHRATFGLAAATTDWEPCSDFRTCSKHGEHQSQVAHFARVPGGGWSEELALYAQNPLRKAMRKLLPGV